MLGSFLETSQLSGQQVSHFAVKETGVPRRNVFSPEITQLPKGTEPHRPRRGRSQGAGGRLRAEAESRVCREGRDGAIGSGRGGGHRDQVGLGERRGPASG